MNEAEIRADERTRCAAVAERWLRFWAAYSHGNEPDRNDRAGGITYGRMQAAKVIADAITKEG